MRTHITYTTQARAHALLHALVHPCTHTHKSTCAYTYTHAHRQTRKQATTHATAQVHPCIHKQQLPPLPKSTRAYKGNSSRHCPNPTPYMATHSRSHAILPTPPPPRLVAKGFSSSPTFNSVLYRMWCMYVCCECLHVPLTIHLCIHAYTCTYTNTNAIHISCHCPTPHVHTQATTQAMPKSTCA